MLQLVSRLFTGYALRTHTAGQLASEGQTWLSGEVSPWVAVQCLVLFLSSFFF